MKLYYAVSVSTSDLIGYDTDHDDLMYTSVLPETPVVMIKSVEELDNALIGSGCQPYLVKSVNL